jgi:hypothetical protein
MMTSLALELLVAQHIADLQREVAMASVAAQLEPRDSPARAWVRNVFHRLAGTSGPRVSLDDVSAWPTLRGYPYRPPSDW